MISSVEIKRGKGGYKTTATMRDGRSVVLMTPGQERWKKGLAGGTMAVIQARLRLRDKLKADYEVVAFDHSWKLQDGEAVLK